MQEESNQIKDNEKWDFSDYAFTITGILVGVLLVGPELLESLMESIFNISILGDSFGDIGENIGPALTEALDMEGGLQRWSFNGLRALSPFLFLLTTTIVFFQEAIVARKTGGYKGSLFTHTFESLFDDAVYMAITTIMVYSAVLFGAMYVSWLAGPISWVLFVFIFPLVRRKTDTDDEFVTPWAQLIIFAAGIIAEVITQAWVAFPLTWLIICAIKLIITIREGSFTNDDVFEIIYLGFSIILMAVGVVLGRWLWSWVAFPLALFICWVYSKIRKPAKAD